MFRSFILTFFLFSIGYSSPLKGSKADHELEKLVDQIYPEMSTFFTKTQITDLFKIFLNVVIDESTIHGMAKQMSKPIILSLSDKQKAQTWDSIQKAKERLGGFNEMKMVFFNALDAVQQLMGETLTKDRIEITSKLDENTSEDDRDALIYAKFREYFNIDFAQVVIDTVKYTMSEDYWNIVIADAPTYMTVSNFDLEYEKQ